MPLFSFDTPQKRLVNKFYSFCNHNEKKLFYYYFTIAIVILDVSWNIMVNKYFVECGSNY